ncbi:MAG TPA: Rrf2 family transcriptional regulator [Candidatus Hydrogenedentes bacterium]|nr:Rrf2 family transcriptional regulator [Candidatus Hydrogenedentota bacterium]HOS03184.1 Rrf2 family transcriptional regulator [Candidatus Hydrogenedentota bacterium]
MGTAWARSVETCRRTPESGFRMNVSSRCEYACRAIIELARHENSDTPVTAMYIAERRRIPEKYLVHILLQLKRAGLVRSVRGAQGGYLLAKSPDDISLFHIIRAIDGPILDPLPVEDAAGIDLEPTWRETAARIEKLLSEVTVRNILDRATKTRMYHI